jgi:hypothetical protein
MTEGNPPTDLRPVLDVLTAKIESLSSKVETVTAKVDVAAARAADQQKEQKQPWWTILTAILGIPGLIFLMYLQFSQGGQARAETQKSIAETEKARTEELKARTELQSELDTLAEKKGQGFAAYQKQLNESLPKLQETLEKLNAANAMKQTVNRDLLIQYVVLWVFVWGIGLLLDFISILWNWGLSIALTFLYPSERPDRESKFAKRLRRAVRVLVPFFNPLPQVLRLSVQIFVFLALFAPLFDQTAASVGSSTKFQGVAHSIKSLRFGEAVGQVKGVIFPAGK